MKLTRQKIEDLHKKYSRDSDTFKRVFTHCIVVNDIAQWCAEKSSEKVDRELLEQACLLHDIGSYGLMGHDGFFYFLYQQHALLGSTLLREEGIDERIVEMVKNHLWLGLTAQEIEDSNLKLPYRDYVPRTIESEMLNYADEFHSKDPKFKTFETQHKTLASQAPTQAAKFQEFAERFGLPDLESLSKKYGHPIV